MNRDVTSLAALEDLLSEARPRARRECHAIAEVLSEAVIFCRSRHGPLTDTYSQLPAAVNDSRRPSRGPARHSETRTGCSVGLDRRCHAERHPRGDKAVKAMAGIRHGKFASRDAALAHAV